MAGATLLEITAGIKGRLATIVGLNASAVEPASPHYPAAWPFLQSADYDQTFDGAMLWTFQITIAVQASSIGEAQTNLMPYLVPTGTKSIKATLEGGGGRLGVATVDSVRVRRIETVGALNIAGGSAVGATMTLEVLA